MDKRRSFATWEIKDEGKKVLSMREYWHDLHQHPTSSKYKCNGSQIWRLMKNGEMRLNLDCKGEASAERVYKKWDD